MNRDQVSVDRYVSGFIDKADEGTYISMRASGCLFSDKKERGCGGFIDKIDVNDGAITNLWNELSKNILHIIATECDYEKIT